MTNSLESIIPSCAVCFEYYGDVYSPRILPCGHSFCSICVTSLERCPLCCAKFEQLDVRPNYQLVDAVQKINTLLEQKKIFSEQIKDLEKQLKEQANEKIVEKTMKELILENKHLSKIVLSRKEFVADLDLESEDNEVVKMLRLEYLKSLQAMEITENGVKYPMVVMNEGVVQKSESGAKIYRYLKMMTLRQLLEYTIPGEMSEEKTTRLTTFLHNFAAEKSKPVNIDKKN